MAPLIKVQQSLHKFPRAPKKITTNWIASNDINSLSHGSGGQKSKSSRAMLLLKPIGENPSLPFLASGVGGQSLVFLGL